MLVISTSTTVVACGAVRLLRTMCSAIASRMRLGVTISSPSPATVGAGGATGAGSGFMDGAAGTAGGGGVGAAGRVGAAVWVAAAAAVTGSRWGRAAMYARISSL